MALRVLSLFAGIGGFDLGLERTGGFTTVAFCEIDPFCRRALAKHWPHVKQYNDVRTLTADTLWQDGITVDVICGGFPCQDVSSSGPRIGLKGKKSGLWFEMHRLVLELRPQFLIVENVADLIHRGLGTVLGDLASSGYDAEWRCIPAAELGLPQTRDRVWIVAYPGSSGQSPGDEWISPRPRYLGWPNDDGLGAAQLAAQEGTGRSWRMDDGIPNWVHRVRSLGNSVAPQIPEHIGRNILAGLETTHA